MVCCELFGDKSDLGVRIDYPAVPQIGSKVILDEDSGEVILSGTVREITYHFSVGDNGMIVGWDGVCVMLKVDYVDDGAISDLVAFQRGEIKEYQTNEVWRAAHHEQWCRTLGEQDAEKLTTMQLRWLRSGELDEALRGWLRDRHSHHVKDIDEQFFKNWVEGVLSVCSKSEAAIS
ncbi:MAG: hypothetical protein KME13_23440 [Myxacorys californica WJT36-NPBG1]|jgi:hypothetical protein|nr:hypothetical protein [Myxacorys californica WJT36-NPBG1]